MRHLWTGPRFRGRPKILTLAVVAAAVAAWLPGGALWVAPAAASTPAIVTLGFDDGTVDQFANGFPILSAHGMHATFFVNTGPITAGDVGHMSWSDLHALFNAGNEIAGHTVDHADLKPLSVADAEHQVCDDRNALLARGSRRNRSPTRSGRSTTPARRSSATAGTTAAGA